MPKAVLMAAMLCASMAVHQLNTQDEAALRALVERYFAAYGSGDLAAWDALWSANSPDRAARRRGMEALIAAGRYTFTPPRLSRVEINGNRASGNQASSNQASLWATTTRTLERGSGTFQTKIALALGLIREDGVWKIYREGPATSELGTLLINTASVDEREALLSIDRDLLTRDLLVLIVNQAERFYRDRDYARALDLHRLAVRLAGINDWKPDAASAWRGIGNVHFIKREHTEALAAYRKSLEIENGLDRKLDRINLWTNIGLVEAARGQTDAALAAFEQGLSLSLEIEDKGGAAATLEQIGRLQRDAGRYSQAAGTYRRVIPLREAIRDRSGAARAMIAVAEVEYDQGESEAAINAYLRALPLIDGKLRVHTLHNLANLYYLQGNYAPALRWYEEERETAARISDAQGEAAAQVGIGLVQSLYGNHAQSLEAYQRNLAINLQLSVQPDTDPRELPIAHQRVGGAWYALGEFDRALEHYEQQLRLREALGDPAETAWALLDVGQALSGKGQSQAALERDERSLKIFEGLKDQVGIGAALLHLAGVHLKADAFAQAREAGDRASIVARASGDTEVYWQSRHRAGRALFRLKQYAAARQSLLDAATTIEGPPGRISNNRPQRAVEPRLAPYLALVDLAVERNQTGEALSVAERAKGRQLKWLLEAGRVRISKSMTAAERAREQELNRRIAALYTQFSRAREQQLPASRLEELQLQLQQARAAMREFEAQIYRLHPQLKVWRGDGPAVSVAQAAQLLPASDAVILEFVETEEQIYLFALARGAGRNAPPRLQGYALGVGREDLIEYISTLQEAAQTRGEGWEGAARYLYDVLLKPAAEHIKTASQLLIVADGVLWNIPFAALQPEDGKFLIESTAVAMSPSLGTLRLAALRSGSLRRAVADRALLPLLAFGYPVLSPATVVRVKVGRRTEHIDLMPETEREAVEVGRLVPGARVYVSAEARLDRLRAEAGNARRLHLAAPATIDEASPFYSSVALAAMPDDPQGAGVVELREWFDWDLSAGLVVLSGAEIAPRGIGTGKGLSGLGWTLAVAGSPSALVRQWRADGMSTTDLMLGFYRESLKTNAPVRAWQSAVVALIKSNEYRHPFFWAGFLLLGG